MCARLLKGSMEADDQRELASHTAKAPPSIPEAVFRVVTGAGDDVNSPTAEVNANRAIQGLKQSFMATSELTATSELADVPEVPSQRIFVSSSMAPPIMTATHSQLLHPSPSPPMPSSSTSTAGDVMTPGSLPGSAGPSLGSGDDGSRLLANVSVLVAQATAKAKAALQLEAPGKLGTAPPPSEGQSGRTAAARAASPKSARMRTAAPSTRSVPSTGGVGRWAGQLKASPRSEAESVSEGRQAVAAAPYRAEARATVAPFWRTSRAHGGGEGKGRPEGGHLMSATQMGRATTAMDVYDRIVSEKEQIKRLLSRVKEAEKEVVTHIKREQERLETMQDRLRRDRVILERFHACRMQELVDLALQLQIQAQHQQQLQLQGRVDRA